MNEFHPSNIISIALGDSRALTRQLLCEIKRVLASTPNVCQVSIEPAEPSCSFPGLRSELRGIRISKQTISAYEGSVVPGRSVLKMLPNASPVAACEMSRIASKAVESLKGSSFQIELYDLWNKLRSQAKLELENAGFRQNIDYMIAPFLPNETVLGILLLDVSRLPQARGALERAALGKNPWEILVSDRRAGGKLLVSIYDGGTDPD